MDIEDVRTWFKSKGSRGDCPVCHANDWSLFATDAAAGASAIVLAVEPPDGAGVDPNTGFGVVGIVCGNCGLVRLISTQVMHKQLRELGYIPSQ